MFPFGNKTVIIVETGPESLTRTTEFEYIADGIDEICNT
jgi:hypothetical protein